MLCSDEECHNRLLMEDLSYPDIDREQEHKWQRGGGGEVYCQNNFFKQWTSGQMSRMAILVAMGNASWNKY